jgi:hypothetical protein
MKRDTSGMVSLRAGDLLRLRSASGMVISCRSGTLWITQEQDTRDIVLRPGACFTLDRSGLALISSLGDGEEPAVLQLLTLSNSAETHCAYSMVRSTPAR